MMRNSLWEVIATAFYTLREHQVIHGFPLENKSASQIDHRAHILNKIAKDIVLALEHCVKDEIELNERRMKDYLNT